jgi:hypothetical protein
MLKYIITFSATLTLLSCSHAINDVDSISSVIIEPIGDTLIKDDTNNYVIFTVDSVQIADTLLKTFLAKHVIEQKIAKQTLFIPEEIAETNLISINGNALIRTIEKSFDEHRPLVY